MKGGGGIINWPPLPRENYSQKAQSHQGLGLTQILSYNSSKLTQGLIFESSRILTIVSTLILCLGFCA